MQKTQGRRQMLRPIMQEIPRIPKFMKQRMMLKAQRLMRTHNKMMQRTQKRTSKMKQTIRLRPQSWIQIQQTRETKALPKFTTPKLKNHAQVYYSFIEWLIWKKFNYQAWCICKSAYYFTLYRGVAEWLAKQISIGLLMT